jgi:hypothetical protein
MGYRVIQWATGYAGRMALRGLIEREEFELVGVWVHGANKRGQDAGELAGMDAVGVVATSDVDEILALDADCVSYMAAGEVRPRECIDDYCRILRAGKNVVTTSVPGLIFAPAFHPPSRKRLEAACSAAGTSLFCSGIEPGFAGDLLPITLATLSQRIDSVRTQEIFSYANTPNPEVMFKVFGFGQPPDLRPPIAQPGVMTAAWGPPLHMVAAALGVELDGVRETFETAVTQRRLDVAAGSIEAGTVAAVRFEVIGVIEGRDVIVIEHVNRMHAEVAPEWPNADGEGVYRVIIHGLPTMTVELELGTRVGDYSDHGMVATAMRAINAIPHVVQAPPGLISALDLPITAPRGALGTSR